MSASSFVRQTSSTGLPRRPTATGSAQDGIDENQWCYPGEIRPGMVVSRRAVGRLGYRLPTEAEAEFIARAGTETARSFGTSEELLPRYAWTWLTSADRTRPVGSLLPNEFGLFDTLGNVWEWCHDGPPRSAPGEYPTYPHGNQRLPRPRRHARRVRPG